MRILHFYPKDNKTISQHVSILKANMGLEAENHVVTELKEAKALMHGGNYDLLHVHGCWRNSTRAVVKMALDNGTRLIVTPHGELEPWAQEERYWKEKLPKKLWYQRDIIQKAYAIIIHGEMEKECMQKLGWNSRCVIIRNALFTHSISPEQMTHQTYMLYCKVMDSNPLELMDDDIKDILRTIIMAGITGDSRWLSSTTFPPISYDNWRRLLCYAFQESLTDTVQKGLRITGLTPPDIEVEKIAFFLPDGFQKTQRIESLIGNQFASENERLIATFRMVKKLIGNQTFCISHLIEIDKELRFHSCQEEELAESLHEKELWKTACRTMQLMAELTGLSEGFMPVPPLDDRTTRRIRQLIDNHLKI